MILRTEIVEQHIDVDSRASFVKDVVMTDGPEALGMVRKRVVPLGATRGVVLLVHGFGQNRYTWHTSRRSFANYLAHAGFDVFNADLRGHGRSRRFGMQRPRVLDEHIRRDLPALVHEALRLSGQKELFIIGHSMGGLITYSAVGSGLRDYVRGIVSIGSPYRFGLGSRFLDISARVGDALRSIGVFDSNPTVPLRAVGKVLSNKTALWDAPFFPTPLRAWVPRSVEGEILSEYLQRAFDQASLSTMLAIFRTRRNSVQSDDGLADYGVAFEQVDVPLLVIAGSHDGIVPPESVRPAFDRSRSMDKSYRIFPLGHVDLVMGQMAPATVWNEIRSWLMARS